MEKDLGKKSNMPKKNNNFQNTKKLLQNFKKVEVHCKLIEISIQKEYNQEFVDVKMEEMTIDDFSFLMRSKRELSIKEVKLMETLKSYLKSKYIVNLINNAIEELKKQSNGEKLYNVLETICFEQTKQADIEDVLYEKGFPMCFKTAYELNEQAIETISIFLWGYDYEYSEMVQGLLDKEFSLSLEKLSK